MTRVTVIILNYNGGQYVIDCIRGVLGQTYHDFEVWVVDNASTDNSGQNIKSLYGEKIVYKELSQNLGFAGGYNTIYSTCKTEYVVLLNNDAIPETNWLQELIIVADRYPNVNLIGSVDVNHDRRKQSTIYFSGDEGHTKPVYIAPDILDHIAPSGNGILIRRKNIDWLFPSWYFAYGEDVFLALRERLQGRQCLVNLRAKYRHLGGMVKKKDETMRDLLTYYGIRNRLINVVVFFKTKTIFRNIPILIMSMILHSFYEPKRALYHCQALYWIISHNEVKELRKQLQQERTISDTKLLKLMA